MLGGLVLGAFLAVVAVVKAAVSFVASHWVAVLSVLALAALAGALLQAKRYWRARRLAQLESLAVQACKSTALDPTTMEALSRLQRELSPLPAETHLMLEAVYRTEVSLALDDRVIENRERERLDVLGQTLGLPSETISKVEMEAFLVIYEAAVADNSLTAHEEEVLHSLGQRLRFDQALIAAQLKKLSEMGAARDALVAQLREAREVMAAPLVAIEAPVRLQDKEVCYHTTAAAQVKERVVDSYVFGGTRYTDRDLVDQQSGILLVTNKRLLFAADGAHSFMLKKILDVKVGSGIVSMVIDGRKTAVHFRAERPHVLAAYINCARDAV